MRGTIAAAADAVAGRPPVPVFVAEWLDPPFAAGHWVPEMVALAGGREVLGTDRRPVVPRDMGRASRPPAPRSSSWRPCGFDADRAAAESAGIRFPCRAVAVEADSYYSRPAPRLADGVAQLAHLLHPGAAPDPGLPAVALEAAWA